MVFNDTTDEQGIIQETRYFVGANTTSYPIADITRNVNRWMDKAVALIVRSNGRWQWDDSNQTDYPIGLTALVTDQQDYTLGVSFLRIERVELKDESGNWSKLLPFDPKDDSQAVTRSDSGVPAYYDATANSLFLYPKPNYSQADSLKVYYQRPSTYFTSTDTTKVPGFASIFHRYLSLGAAYDYALKNGLQNRNQLREEVLAMEEEMKVFYALRQPDEHIRLRSRTSGKRLYK